MRKLFILSLPLILSTGALAGPDATSSSPATAELGGELGLLQDLFFKAQTLQYLLHDPKLLGQLVQKRWATGAQLQHQVPALEARQANLVESIVTRVGTDLDAGSTDSLEIAVQTMESQAPPQNLAYVALARSLLVRTKYVILQGAPESLKSKLSALVQRLSTFLARTKTGPDPAKAVNSFARGMSVPDFWRWFCQGDTMRAVIDPVSAAESRSKLDLNQARADQLTRIPGITATLAARIVDYRTSHGGFIGISDLSKIPGIGAATLQKLNDCGFVGELARPVKDWTILVYMITSNNREPEGMKEFNLMEQAGSDDHLNVILQMGRIDGPNMRHQDEGDDTSNGNWASVRRYYVTRDKNPIKIGSTLLATLGQADMGSPQTLIDFCRWGITTFPARHYWLILADHGGGSLWTFGIDDNYGHSFTVKQISDSITAAGQFLREQTKRTDARIDVVSFDACMMGMLEIAYEIKEYVRVMIASEDLAYGPFEHGEDFSFLSQNAQCSPADLARKVVALRLDHMMTRKRSEPGVQLSVVALDLENLEPLRVALNNLGEALQSALPRESASYTDAVTNSVSIDNTPYRDIDLVCENLARRSHDAAVETACRDVRTVLGCPPAPRVNGPVSGIAIDSPKPCSVIWGINQWRGIPPQAIWPKGSQIFLQRNMVRTPLMGPDAQGRWSAVFETFDPGQLSVEQINYRLLGVRGGLGPSQTINDFAPSDSHILNMQFDARSPLIAEAHTGGYWSDRGLSMVLPVPGDDDLLLAALKTNYQQLKWAADTSWGKLVLNLAFPAAAAP